MEICPVDQAVLEVALMLAVKDFEDAVQVGCALAQRLDAIVTRDADFASKLIRVSPLSEILHQLESHEPYTPKEHIFRNLTFEIKICEKV